MVGGSSWFAVVEVENLAGIEQSFGVERALDLAEQQVAAGVELPAERLLLCQTHAVLAGDGSTEFEGAGENFIHRGFHPVHFLFVPFVG